MLTEGTRTRDWQRIADEAESKGMVLSSSGTFETTACRSTPWRADWELALDWAAELLFESSFPEDRCAWLARQAAAELESLADQPDVKTAWGFLDQLYSPHPRCRSAHGSVESLLALTPADCAGFHRRRPGARHPRDGGRGDGRGRRARPPPRALLDPSPGAEPYPEPPAPAGFGAPPASGPRRRTRPTSTSATSPSRAATRTTRPWRRSP